MLEITNTNAGDVISAYNKLREAKSDITLKHKEELKPVNEGLQEMEDAMLIYLTENKLQSLKGEHGTAYKKIRSSATVTDREAFLDVVTADPSLLPLMEVRASAKTIEEYLADDGDMPAGVKLTRHTQVIFNRGK